MMQPCFCTCVFCLLLSPVPGKYHNAWSGDPSLTASPSQDDDFSCELASFPAKKSVGHFSPSAAEQR